MAHSPNGSLSRFSNSIGLLEDARLNRFLSPTQSEAGIREKLPCMRGKLCPNLAYGGTCNKRDECDYSHDVDEVRRYNHNFKTKLCSFAINGGCKKANGCRYAHSLSELSPEMSDASLSPSKTSGKVGRNISTVSTHADMDTTPRTSPRASHVQGSLLELPTNLAPVYPGHFTPANLPSVVIPSSSHYVDQLNRQVKFIVPRNVHTPKECMPSYLASPAHLFYNPSLGIYQPIPLDPIPQSEVYED